MLGLGLVLRSGLQVRFGLTFFLGSGLELGLGVGQKLFNLELQLGSSLGLRIWDRVHARLEPELYGEGQDYC